MGNRGTCSDTHYIRLDFLRDKVLDELQRLLKAAKSTGFWDRVAVVKSIESQKTIQKLMEQQRIMDKRQSELRKYLATAYEDKVKGVIDDETFVLLSNKFKKERDLLKEAQQRIQTECETAQKFQSGLTQFKKEVEGQAGIVFWHEILSDNLSTRLQFIQQIEASGHISRKLKFIITSSGKLRKSYKPLIVRECSYSICPI